MIKNLALKINMSGQNSSKVYAVIDQMGKKLIAAQQELELYKRRYEYVKGLNADTFDAVHKASTDLNLSFDTIVDSWTADNKQNH